ncbi:MAG: hypothetical protein K0R93_1539 [Anaerosolibacter sp.]|uniref:CAP and S-layer homology domain-containing protein n=1 Tax=Anaerosolibacter sp. TaxID=1872527 RepID=UPI00262DAA33|nr:S-layer homology domain-containing protein [Anaerosolibacter sp.]MDF2546641.1 hypothetical protein [Anaerosolibacter sp.]
MRNRWIYKVLLTCIIFIFAWSGTVFGEGVSLYTPMPQGNVMVSKPTISWQIILNNNVIENIDMKLDGNKVEAKYNKETASIEYIPSEAIKGGRHTVDVSVVLKEWSKPISRSWQFTVSDQAVEQLSAPNTEQKTALEYANQYRGQFQLTPFQLDPSLNAAASAHADYMTINQELTHVESANRKGFVGTNPQDRAASFGYTSSFISENVSSGQKDYREAVNGLVDAPYHRFSWLNPYLSDLGYSSRDKYYSFLFGGKTAGEDQLVVYPLDHQKGVTVSWDGNETPDPLRIHRKKEKVGYPVTLSYFTGKNIVKFSIDKATLSNSQGKNVEVFLNTPQNDDNLKDSIIMIPVDSFDMGEKYTATVKGSIIFEDKTEKKIDKTWTFETAIFTDVFDHWGRNDILDLGSKKIITPKKGSEYRPEDKITRAEFAEFIVNVLEIPVKDYEGIFKDVGKETNKAVFVEAAYRAGVVKGMGDGSFAPNRWITREEISALVIRAYEKKGNMDKIKELPAITFADRYYISPWALGDIKAVVRLGIMKGRLNNEFAPKDYATRAEAAVIMKGLLGAL